MKIQTIPQQQIKLENKNSNNIDTKNNPQFTGAFEAFSLGLRFLDTNQAMQYALMRNALYRNGKAIEILVFILMLFF